jgi:hypothetical protein
VATMGSRIASLRLLMYRDLCCVFAIVVFCLSHFVLAKVGC